MSKKLNTLFFALLLLSSSTVFATNYTITVSGFAYSPDSLNVNVGDVITWNCSFTNHPLESTSVPAGATAFSANTGTIYTYTITTAGTYRYQCSFHGFTGVLIASNASSISEFSIPTSEFSIYPNPANSSVTISVDEKMIGSMLTVTDLTGKKMTAFQLVTSNQKLNTENFSNGVYFITIETINGRTTHKLIIQK